MKKTLLTMAAAFALVGCSESELVETPVQEQNAIAFGTYVGDNAQSRASIVTTETLGADGFGVNAYYTEQDDFADGAELNFMHNTKVTYNKDNQKWEYSPVKYWPNNSGDMVSFFAYGPYAKSAGNNNITQNGTSLEFVVPDEVKDQVDLIYNTNYDGTINQTKPSVEELIHFQFGHALSRISFTVEAAVDEVVNGNNLLDGNTRINVKKVALVSNAYDAAANLQAGPFYTDGTLSLLNPGTADDGTPNSPWSNTTGSQGFVFDATNHFYHTVKDVDAEDMTGAEIDVVQLTRFNASEPQRLLNDDSYLMVIPQADAEFKIYIEYDVISGGYENNGGGIYDESAITNKITSEKALKVTFEQGKAYNFNLVLGMTSVKVDAKVTEWGDEINGGNVWLPENTEAALRYDARSSVFEIYNDKQLDQMRRLVNSGATYTVDAEGNVTTIESRATRSTEGTSYAKASYKLMEDIDLSGYANWEPIGLTEHTPFEGIFDGNGKKIENYTITITDTEYEAMKDGYQCYIGLFNRISSAVIKGLTASGHITTEAWTGETTVWLSVGGIIGGSSYASKIYDCHFSGTLTNNQGYAMIGGIIGNANGQIVRCTSTGVTLTNTAANVTYGGIAADAPDRIAACYTYGNDFTNANLLNWGGIAGLVVNHLEDRSVIESCYNYDAVSSSIAQNVGGILGEESRASKQYMANCYSVAMDGMTNFVGRYGDTPQTPVNCGFIAADGDWTNARDAMNNALIALDAEDQKGNKTGLYAVKFQATSPGAAYPLEVVDGLAEYVDLPYTAFEEGDEDNGVPTLYIKSAADLAGLSKNVANGFKYNDTYSYAALNYIQVADIDLSTVCSETLGSWTPIGNSTYRFSGTYTAAERDENDESDYAKAYKHYVISNLYIKDSNKLQNQGLFGMVYANSNFTEVLTNIHIIDGCIETNGNYTGGVLGNLVQGSIAGCSFDGTLKLSDDAFYCGAVVGCCYGWNTISDCSFVNGTLEIEGNCSMNGGVVGSTSGTVKNSYTAKDVTMTVKNTFWSHQFGGVIGHSSNATIEGCFNEATIISEAQDNSSSLESRIGGVVGEFRGGKITGCWNAGSISGYEVAGVIGEADGYTNVGSVYGCYNIGVLNGDKSSAGIINVLDTKYDYDKNANWNIIGCYNTAAATYGIVADIVESTYSDEAHLIYLTDCYYTNETAIPTIENSTKLQASNNHQVDETNCKWVKGSEDGTEVTCAKTAMNTALENKNIKWTYSANDGDDATTRPLIISKTE